MGTLRRGRARYKYYVVSNMQEQVISSGREEMGPDENIIKMSLNHLAVYKMQNMYNFGSPT